MRDYKLELRNLHVSPLDSTQLKVIRFWSGSPRLGKLWHNNKFVPRLHDIFFFSKWSGTVVGTEMVANVIAPRSTTTPSRWLMKGASLACPRNPS
jgi:hypothetical protein